jgi:hypothetical protein
VGAAGGIPWLTFEVALQMSGVRNRGPPQISRHPALQGMPYLLRPPADHRQERHRGDAGIGLETDDSLSRATGAMALPLRQLRA